MALFKGDTSMMNTVIHFGLIVVGIIEVGNTSYGMTSDI